MSSSTSKKLSCHAIHFVHTLRSSISDDVRENGIVSHVSHAFQALDEKCHLLRLSSADSSLMGSMVASCLASQPDIADLPVSVKDACDCQAVVLNTDLCRAQQLMVCEAASTQAATASGKCGSTKTILLIDDSTLEHAGPGSWPEVFASATAVVLTASAAKALAASDDTETAARSIQYMCRNGGYFIVDCNRLVYGCRNQVREMVLEQTELSLDQLMAKCAAVVATGTIQGNDSEQMAYATVAMITIDSPTTWPLLEQRGRRLCANREEKLARRKVVWRRASFVGTATISSLLVMAIVQPWL